MQSQNLKKIMSKKLSKEIYKKAFSLMCTARAMSDLYEKIQLLLQNMYMLHPKDMKPFNWQLGYNLPKTIG